MDIKLLHIDLDKVAANTCAISQVTHADPRCTASCVAATTAVSSIIAILCGYITV